MHEGKVSRKKLKHQAVGALKEILSRRTLDLVVWSYGKDQGQNNK
jgi:hypothetical protein